MLELTGANSFRVSSYARVGREINDLAIDITTLTGDEKGIAAIDGIGASSAKKINEYLETGEMEACICARRASSGSNAKSIPTPRSKPSNTT